MGSSNRSEVDFDRLLRLREGDKPRAIRARSVESLGDPVALLLAVVPPEPVAHEVTEGSVAYDLVGTEYVAIKLISDHFVEVLSAGGFTGWATFPVTLAKPGGEAIEGYHGLAVRGRSGPIDDSLSEQIVLPAPVPTGRTRSGLRGRYFAPETWDGSDVFVPQDSGWVFVTEPVASALREAEVTNIGLEVLSTMERLIY